MVYRKGAIPWNKGKEFSEEIREKMREKKHLYFLNGGKPWNKQDYYLKCKNCGIKFKVIKARLKTAKYCSINCCIGNNVFSKGSTPWNKGKQHIRGEKHWNWKGGVDKEHTRIKQSSEYKKWQQEVYRKYNWTCQVCSYKGKSIVAHHIKLFSQYPELRFDIKNGIVLCRACHQNHHKPRRKDYYAYKKH